MKPPPLLDLCHFSQGKVEASNPTYNINYQLRSTKRLEIEKASEKSIGQPIQTVVTEASQGQNASLPVIQHEKLGNVSTPVDRRLGNQNWWKHNIARW